MTSTLSLTGKKSYNKLTLSGKSYNSEQNIPLEIKKIKILILNNLIIPVITKQWKILNENLFCIEKAKRRIDYYYETYKLDDLSIYKEIIKAFELVICEHQQLEDLEKKMYSSNKDLSTMIYKTAMVRLKPEYEIYDNVLGKPDRTLKAKLHDLTATNEVTSIFDMHLLLDLYEYSNLKSTVFICSVLFRAPPASLPFIQKEWIKSSLPRRLWWRNHFFQCTFSTL